MGGEFYGDTLDASDKRMDYDPEDYFKQDPLKQLTFKVKSAPGNGLTMSNGADMVRGKAAGTWDFKHKTELAYACGGGRHTTKFTGSNKDFTLNVVTEPENMNANHHTQFEVEGKCTPQKAAFEGKAIARIGNFKLGDLSTANEFEFSTNQAKEHALSYSTNAAFQNYRAAWRMNYSVSGKKLSDAYGYLALLNHSSGNYYFRSNCLNRFIGFGWFDGQRSAEVQYDVDRKAKGIRGQPVFIRYGRDYKAADGSKFNYKFNIGSASYMTMKWDH